MVPPVDKDGFHPEDPTKWLWKKLLRSRPLIDGRPPKTKAQKKQIAVRVQTYYTEHLHPRRDKPISKKRKK